MADGSGNIDAGVRMSNADMRPYGEGVVPSHISPAPGIESALSPRVLISNRVTNMFRRSPDEASEAPRKPEPIRASENYPENERKLVDQMLDRLGQPAGEMELPEVVDAIVSKMPNPEKAARKAGESDLQYYDRIGNFLARDIANKMTNEQSALPISGEILYALGGEMRGRMIDALPREKLDEVVDAYVDYATLRDKELRQHEAGSDQGEILTNPGDMDYARTQTPVTDPDEGRSLAADAEPATPVTSSVPEAEAAESSDAEPREVEMRIIDNNPGEMNQNVSHILDQIAENGMEGVRFKIAASPKDFIAFRRYLEDALIDPDSFIMSDVDGETVFSGQPELVPFDLTKDNSPEDLRTGMEQRLKLIGQKDGALRVMLSTKEEDEEVREGRFDQLRAVAVSVAGEAKVEKWLGDDDKDFAEMNGRATGKVRVPAGTGLPLQGASADTQLDNPQPTLDELARRQIEAVGRAVDAGSEAAEASVDPNVDRVNARRNEQEVMRTLSVISDVATSIADGDFSERKARQFIDDASNLAGKEITGMAYVQLDEVIAKIRKVIQRSSGPVRLMIVNAFTEKMKTDINAGKNDKALETAKAISLLDLDTPADNGEALLEGFDEETTESLIDSLEGV